MSSKQDPTDLFIEQIKESQFWPALLERFESQRPIIPVFNAKNDNSDLWKLTSGSQLGYDSCLAVLKLKMEK